MNRVLITGAGGFIGRHCLPRLLERGYTVHAVRRPGRPEPTDAPAATHICWHATDLLDAVAVENLIAQVRPSHLLHLAWNVTPGVYWTTPENLRWLEAGTALYRAFGEAGGRRAVGVGSCAEYDWGFGACREADTPTRPATVYGRCKLALGEAAAAAAAAYGLSQAWARLFFVYGPGEPSPRLIPDVIDGLAAGREVRCSHGRQVRDYVYVEDVAAALIALLDHDIAGPVNLGSGLGVTLRELVRLIADRMGGWELVRWGALPLRPGDPACLVADTGRCRRELGWTPGFDLAAGLERTIAARLARPA